MGKHTDEKKCYCHTCDRWFNYLGIATHRSMHLKRDEQCKITYTNGDTYVHGDAVLQQRSET